MGLPPSKPMLLLFRKSRSNHVVFFDIRIVRNALLFFSVKPSRGSAPDHRPQKKKLLVNKASTHVLPKKATDLSKDAQFEKTFQKTATTKTKGERKRNYPAMQGYQCLFVYWCKIQSQFHFHPSLLKICTKTSYCDEKKKSFTSKGANLGQALKKKGF